jgi:prepilin peptidase CpaA
MPMLPSATLDLMALLGFVAVLAAAAISDVRHFIVPNRYCVSIVLLYGIHVLASPVPVSWTGGLIVAGASLAVGFALFAVKAFGGGDVKLFVAASLWAGGGHIAQFIVGTAVVGGLLATAILLQRRAPSHATPGAADAPQPQSRWKRPLPYGVAIAAGGAQTAVMLFLGR